MLKGLLNWLFPKTRWVSLEEHVNKRMGEAALRRWLLNEDNT